MENYLEWSNAYAGRLEKDDCKIWQDRAGALGARLAKELAAGQLPFLSMPYRKQLDEDMPKAMERMKGFRHMLLLGIGGSALGARAIQKAFAPGQDGPNYAGPWLWICDNVCAEQFEGLLAKLKPSETIVLCISKSGGTIETLAQYFLARKWLQDALGDGWQKQMIVVTDPQKGFLRQEAGQNSLAALEAPDFLGGRYSALSAVGMVPAAFLGIDWKGLLDGAAKVAKPLADNPAEIARHPSFDLACWARGLEATDYSELIFFCYIPQWSYYGDWFAQLWAESLGKDGRGMMPIPATGVTDQHSINQMFLDGPRNKGCLFLTGSQPDTKLAFGQDLPGQWAWLKGKAFSTLLEAEALGTRMALCQSRMPLVQINMGNLKEEAAGSLMMLLEAATIFTGWLLEINPVDQPAVELGKRLANSRLGASGYAEEARDLAAYLAREQVKQAF